MTKQLSDSTSDITKAMQDAQGALSEVFAARRRVAVALRNQGKSWREIGDTLGVTRQRAKQMVQQETKAAAGAEINPKP